jgi:hypothetical protein
MQVSEYRKCVDYSNTTQNELRFFENEQDFRIYYPLGNMYPNKYSEQLLKLPFTCLSENNIVEKEWFNERLQDQQIKYAIEYLQVDALKKFVKRNHTSVVLFMNPFFHLFYTIYPIQKNIEATKQIIQILVDNYDDHYNLITKLQIVKKEDKFVLNLMYDFLPEDENNVCSICLKTEPKKFLIHTCTCKTPAHANCLIELNKYKKLDTCMVCKTKYKINEPIARTMSGIIINEVLDETIYFPFHDMYYAPLLNNPQLEKYSGMSRLTMAVMYLQVERVKELLQKQDVLDELPNYYFGYPAYKQTPIHALCTGNFPTNASMSFKSNVPKYVKILKMLLDTNKIDKYATDAFGKTAYDIVIENNKHKRIFLSLGLFES